MKSIRIPDRPVSKNHFAFKHPASHPLPRPLTGRGVCQAAGLDWAIREAPVTFAPPGLVARASALEVEEVKVLFRSDTLQALGVVPARFEPTQPDEVIDHFLSFAGFYSFPFTAAGCLKGGKLIWGLMQVADAIGVRNGCQLWPHLLIAKPFDSSAAALITAICIVDTPTVTISAIEPAGSTRIYYSAEFLTPAALMEIGFCVTEAVQLSRTLQDLSTISMKPIDVRDYAATLIDPETRTSRAIRANGKKIDRLVQQVATLKQPSMLDVLLSYAHMVDAGGPKGSYERLHYGWFGEGAARKQQAVKLAAQALR